MPFEIVRNDITCMKADAIVNPVSPEPGIGYGTDSAVHRKAGAELIEARRKAGSIPFGDAKITPAFELDADYVIHTATPVWQGGNRREAQLLASCYTRSLELAEAKGCRSIAFPLLASGNHGFPKDMALHEAIGAISRFLMDSEMQVWLVVYNHDAYVLSEKLFSSVKSFIDDRYIEDSRAQELPAGIDCYPESDAVRRRIRAEIEYNRQLFMESEELSYDFSRSAPSAAAPDLEKMLEDSSETFSEHLLHLIDSRNLTDPQVYRKANIDRRLFSKIRKSRDYNPSKQTCLAFAIALELDIDETQDLLARAGYTLSRSSRADIIVEYFILSKNYDIFEINQVLFAFGQPLIGR